MLTHVQPPPSSTIVSILPLQDPLNVCNVVELPEQTTGLFPATASKTVQAKQPQPELLLMPLSETYTAYQKRAALAGQHYYLEHFYGTYASHKDLCTFLKRKLRQWDRHHTSTEWKIYWVGGWHTALLSDATADLDGPRNKEAYRQHPGPSDAPDRCNASTETSYRTQRDTEAHMPDQMPAPLSPLVLHEPISALAVQPDFLEGLQDAQAVYEDNEYEGILTEAEMMNLVGRNLTRRARERDRRLCRFAGLQQISYVHALGLVVGLIGTGFVRQPL